MTFGEKFASMIKRDPSKKDAKIFAQEYTNDASQSFEMQEINEMLDKMDQVMRKFYPALFNSFHSPSLDRIEGNLTFIQQALLRDNSTMGKSDRSYLAATAVRYVDNFIDEVLWPAFQSEIERHGLLSQQTTNTYHAFIKMVYAVTLAHDPYIPEEITEIPLLEYKMLAQPDQKTVDETIRNYFFYKSFNLAYIEHLLKRERAADSALWTDVEKNKFLLLAAWDVARDMLTWGDKTDFDVFKHISDHKLDPRTLIDFLHEIIQKNSSFADQENAEFERRALNDCSNMISYLEHIHDPDFYNQDAN
jgi:ElaB/YqjD/DUF883 family membrane-anchored ribosome-binding protein